MSKVDYVINRIINGVNVGEEVTAKDVIDRFCTASWCPSQVTMGWMLSYSDHFKAVGERRIDIKARIDESSPYNDEDYIYKRTLYRTIYKRVS